MKRSQIVVSEPAFVDGVAEEGDVVEVVTNKTTQGYTLYVHVNGETVLRLGRIQRLSLDPLTFVMYDPADSEQARKRAEDRQ